MPVYGIIWKYMELYGIIWDQVEVPWLDGSTAGAKKIGAFLAFFRTYRNKNREKNVTGGKPYA